MLEEKKHARLKSVNQLIFINIMINDIKYLAILYLINFVIFMNIEIFFMFGSYK